MGRPRKKPKVSLEQRDDGHYYIVVEVSKGQTKEIDAGRSKPYAEKVMREMFLE